MCDFIFIYADEVIMVLRIVETVAIDIINMATIDDTEHIVADIKEATAAEQATMIEGETLCTELAIQVPLMTISQLLKCGMNG